MVCLFFRNFFIAISSIGVWFVCGHSIANDVKNEYHIDWPNIKSIVLYAKNAAVIVNFPLKYGKDATFFICIYCIKIARGAGENQGPGREK